MECFFSDGQFLVNKIFPTLEQICKYLFHYETCVFDREEATEIRKNRTV